MGILKHVVFFKYLQLLCLICGHNSWVILQNAPHWADVEMKKLGKNMIKKINFHKKIFWS